MAATWWVTFLRYHVCTICLDVSIFAPFESFDAFGCERIGQRCFGYRIIWTCSLLVLLYLLRLVMVFRSMVMGLRSWLSPARCSRRCFVLEHELMNLRRRSVSCVRHDLGVIALSSHAFSHLLPYLSVGAATVVYYSWVSSTSIFHETHALEGPTTSKPTLPSSITHSLQYPKYPNTPIQGKKNHKIGGV